MPTPATTAPALQHVQAVQRAGAIAQADPYRACTLCDHGPRASGQHDTCAMGGHPVQSVQVARAAYGACGPEARHLRIDGWDLTS